MQAGWFDGARTDDQPGPDAAQDDRRTVGLASADRHHDQCDQERAEDGQTGVDGTTRVVRRCGPTLEMAIRARPVVGHAILMETGAGMVSVRRCSARDG